ncbi:MAG: alpha-ketoglutarate-dependent dioxygenase AlkB [Pseudomonadota bacterium]
MADVTARFSSWQLPGADAVFQDLLKTVAWRSERLRLYGREHEVPRQIAWAGDAGVTYRYSRIDHVASGWSSVLANVRSALEQRLKARYNFVLLNHYRHGQDAMGWHTDDEPELEGQVASVSLGATRRFRYEDAQGQRHSILLQHGQVIEIPRHLPHCLPRMRRVDEPRINLSFRWVR